MGVEYLGVCHTCGVVAELGYGSYLMWNRPNFPAQMPNRNAHRFVTEHKYCVFCFVTYDWWCSCMEHHMGHLPVENWEQGNEDWESRHSIQETQEFLKAGSIFSYSTCAGYAQYCRCYY